VRVAAGAAVPSRCVSRRGRSRSNAQHLPCDAMARRVCGVPQARASIRLEMMRGRCCMIVVVMLGGRPRVCGKGHSLPNANRRSATTKAVGMRQSVLAVASPCRSVVNRVAQSTVPPCGLSLRPRVCPRPREKTNAASTKAQCERYPRYERSCRTNENAGAATRHEMRGRGGERGSRSRGCRCKRGR